jgi:hypothetical protein
VFRTVLTLAFLLLFPTASALAADGPEQQRIELDATLGYRFGGAREVQLQEDDGTEVPGKVTVDGAPSWGGLFAYRIQSNGTVFFSYTRQSTTMRFRPDDLNATSQEDLSGKGSIEYFNFGGNLEAHSGALYPYLGVSLGLARFAAGSGGDGAQIRFNMALDTGIRFHILPLIDLRVFGRVPFTFTSSDFYCYSGHGCAAVVTQSPFVQGEVGVGLGLRL